MREGPLRGNKNRIPWSHHDMAQTFSLWGKTMFLTAVRVFITFSSLFFFPVQLCFLKNALYKRHDIWQPSSAALRNSLASTLRADCIKHISLFIYLFRQKSEGPSHTINAQHSITSSRKNGRGVGEGGAGVLLLRNLIMGAKTVLQPPSLVAVLEHTSDSQISRHLGNIN